MPTPPRDALQQQVTGVLRRMAAGDPDAADALAPLIYEELRKIAHNHLRKERIGHTLQPTALVHETYLRLVGMRNMNWENRTHFVAVAARLMRHILIDYARRRNTRAEGHADADGTDALARIGGPQRKELIAVDDALKRLEEVDSRQAQIVEMKFFGGLSVEEIAHALDLSERTVKREWAAAKVWLHDEMAAG
jgi:RNA polymerase sigma factor (TIGR02999 family)